MPQELRVLLCGKCEKYQVDIVKKSNKWQCKVCNETQNVLKEFFRGSGPECRAKTQQLNLMHAGRPNELNTQFSVGSNENNTMVDFDQLITNKTSETQSNNSKWNKYI